MAEIELDIIHQTITSEFRIVETDRPEYFWMRGTFVSGISKNTQEKILNIARYLIQKELEKRGENEIN